jgi:hypothetical protein
MHRGRGSHDGGYHGYAGHRDAQPTAVGHGRRGGNLRGMGKEGPDGPLFDGVEDDDDAEDNIANGVQEKDVSAVQCACLGLSSVYKP